jgi:DNA repair protein RecN (Recombination protein N)
MLRRIGLRDFVIVQALDIDLQHGFTALTGETGAGKSILIDALQLALGERADATIVREGATRADISAEFDAPSSLSDWLIDQGFEADEGDGGTLLLRRTMDSQGRSRAWINGRAATLAQLREAAEHLVDIHGQHAWQSLTRPAATRALLDEQAGADTAALARAWQVWRQAQQTLTLARERQSSLQSERERLTWQLGELGKLSPEPDEWLELNAEHSRLSHAQSLIDSTQQALAWLSDDEFNADGLTDRAIDQLTEAAEFDPSLNELCEILRSAQAQLQDVSRSLHSYLGRSEPDPARLAELDERLSSWLSLARRYRQAPEDLPVLMKTWQAELAQLDAASDLQALEQRERTAHAAWKEAAGAVSKARRAAAPRLSAEITAAMQTLGMAGGRFEVALLPQTEPQAYGLEQVEFQVAGHAGSSVRPLAKVASGGELSRLALAIATTVARAQPSDTRQTAATLIFDEIDAGVGGAVGDAVGRLMRELGQTHQVLAVTHLAQVAACADHHLLVAKALHEGQTLSQMSPIAGEARIGELARMMGGEHASETSRAHARALLTRPGVHA